MKLKKKMVTKFCISSCCVLLISILLNGVCSGFFLNLVKGNVKEDSKQDGMVNEERDSSSKETLELKDTKLDHLTVTVKDCNIEIHESDTDEIYGTYDEKICKVSMKEKKKKATIKFEGTSDDCQNYMDLRIFKLYLPKKLTVDKVSIISKHAGIRILYFPDSDLEIESNQGSIYFVEPKDFQHTISVNSDRGTISACLLEAKPEEVSLQGKTNMCDYPKGWEKITKQKEGRITFSVSNSNFFIHTKELEDGNTVVLVPRD